MHATRHCIIIQFIRMHVWLQIPTLAQSWSPGPSLCPKECTSRFKHNLTVFGAALHMHQVRKSATE